MKTNITITALTLALLTQTAMAQKFLPARASAQRIAPIQSPAVRNLPQVPAAGGHRSVLPSLKPSVLPQVQNRIAPPVKLPSMANVPAIRKPQALPGIAKLPVQVNANITRHLNGNAGSAVRTVPVKPAGVNLGGLDAGKAESIRQGAALANGIKPIEQLRGNNLGNDLPHGLPDTSGNGSGIQAPRDPFAQNDTNYGATPKAPDHITRNLGGNGLTDIRGGYNNSRKGNGSTMELAPTTRRVTESSSRGVFGSGSSSTASGPVRITQDETTGELVATQTGTDANGNQARIDVIQETDDNGTITGTTEIITRSDGESATSQTIIRDADGNVISDKTEKTTPGTHAIDRGNFDVSMGGPVGPGVAAVTGLVPLDLLRQPSGNEASGGTNYMTNGRLSARLVNPGSRNDMNPLPDTLRNRIAPSDDLAGPTTGGSAGGTGLPE